MSGLIVDEGTPVAPRGVAEAGVEKAKCGCIITIVYGRFNHTLKPCEQHWHGVFMASGFKDRIGEKMTIESNETVIE